MHYSNWIPFTHHLSYKKNIVLEKKEIVNVLYIDVESERVGGVWRGGELRKRERAV